MTFEEAYQQIRKHHYKIRNERESISKSARLSLSTWILDILTECRDKTKPQPEEWSAGKHESFYSFLWNVINPNEMQGYIEMFESKGKPVNTDLALPNDSEAHKYNVRMAIEEERMKL